MDPELRQPPPTETNKPAIGPPPTPDKPTQSLEQPIVKSPDESKKIAEARAEISELSAKEIQSSNPPKRNSSIIGANPYTHIPSIRAEETDNIAIVKEQNFKPEEFSNQEYFHGRGLGSNYGLVKNGYDAYDNNRYWKPVVDVIRKYVKPENTTRVLDVGCAAGYLVKRLQAAGFGEIIGIDISPSVLEAAKKNAPEARFEQVNLNTDLFNKTLEGTFDAITAMDVIEHTAHRTGANGEDISGPEHVIPKLTALLKEGGIFIMNVPVQDRNPISWLWNRFDSDKSHVSKLSSEKYLEILKANGLEMLEKHYSFLLPWFKIPFLPVGLETICRKNSAPATPKN